MAPGVVVVGAGISGLVTAYRLAQSREDLDIQVLEASPRAGGTMGTESVHGFAFERGPNGFLDNVPQTVELSTELGLGDRLLRASEGARNRFLWKNGRLLPLPQKPMELLTSPLLSLRGKLRLLLEPFQGREQRGVEESVAAFARRRLGQEAATTFLDPLVTGVYGGDAERISLDAAFPSVAALEREHGSLFRGFRVRAKERRLAEKSESSENAPTAASAAPPASSRTHGTLCSFEQGLEELVRALSERLGPRLRLGSPVEEVRLRRGEGYEVVLRDRNALRSRAVVLALPAPRAATLVSSWNSDLAMSLEEIPYAPIAVICLGYARADVGHPLDGFGFLIPRDQGCRTLGAIFVSTLFPCHAPEGMVSLRAMVGGARDPEAVGLSEDDLIGLVLREIGPVLDVRGEPAVRRVYRYTQGIPQYNVGHSKRLRRIDGWLRQLPGLFLTGNAYRGVGLNDCVADGGRVSSEALDFLGSRQGAA